MPGHPRMTYGPEGQAFAMADAKPVRWGPALGYGLLIALVGGAIWGVVAAATGYIFSLMAIVMGFAVAWGLAKGAGSVTGAVILLGVVLTMFAVFLADIVGISIVAGVSPLDVLAAYPEIVALAPGETAIAYVFGLIGASYGGYKLWQARRAQLVPPPSPAPSTQGSSSMLGASQVTRGAHDVTLETAVPTSNPHRVRAYYTAMTGRAEVFIDDQFVAKTRVWGAKKEVAVPLSDTAQQLSVRFRGTMAPEIDVLLDGALIATT